MSRPLDVVLGALVRNGCDPRWSGDGWVARCPGPGHEPDDGNRALSIAEAPDGHAILDCHGKDDAKGVSHSSHRAGRRGADGMAFLTVYRRRSVRKKSASPVSRRPGRSGVSR